MLSQPLKCFTTILVFTDAFQQESLFCLGWVRLHNTFEIEHV